MNKVFEIVSEDQYFLVLNKIARIVVQPSPKKEKRTLTSLLEKHLKEKIYICHRLDKNTQGLIIYAKSKQIHKNITGQFRKREVKKKYLALTEGNFKKNKGVFKGLILDKEGRKFKEKPKKSETSYKVLKRCKGFDFIELIPKTGRTNQIRIHLAQAGHPILGEKKYAFRRDFMIKFNKLALCAYWLKLRHPVSSQQIMVKIGVPEYMKNFIEKGRRL
ncbi:MAG: RNA pseudouridine synthase [Candidatus Omnitrophica bacterium]|nr:RNA pseudouridine synthase [Candidatus Omnitrophota bacterium]MCF7876764.1 RNA pseudouridine synthase [Candidatus Omnitrophota bacterium]MCF7878196.1 RNA pseudouridine synthase [Candidatus Omnitrophota bacterium]MCF7892680.1 RNA pseudouridine synthase [Candidatus Omnitrophota bacterium]